MTAAGKGPGDGLVAVLGLGAMGAGIAEVCAQAGLSVLVLEQSEQQLEQGLRSVAQLIRRAVDAGRLGAQESDATRSRISGTTTVRELAGASIVLEAVFEDLELKRTLLAEVSAELAGDAIVATNTSALSISAIAAQLPHPERVAGLHFFNPAPVMPLVEVVAGARTAEATIDALQAFARRIGKEPIVTKDRPGFLVNRLLMPYLNQAVQDVDDGLASPEDLDLAIKLGLGYPMGPLELLDLIGLDTHLRATSAAWEQTRDSHLVAPPALDRLVCAGALGRKTGEGFHRYPR